MSREMKESGLGWIGKIPKTWSVNKFKFHTLQKNDRNPGGAIILSLYREYGIVIKDSRDDNFNRTSLDTSSYRHVEVNDFVVNKMKAWQGSVAVSEYEGVVSPAYYVYRITDNNIYPRYLHHLIRGCYKDEFMRLSGGIRIGQWDLPADALGNTMILIPPLDEQKAISNYIDVKCSAIDTAIEKTKKSIEKLEEYKKAVITKAVTKGLDPDAKMKDSGIEWIGEVPETWDTLRIKHSSWLKGRIGWDELKSEEFIDDGPYLITGTDFNDGIVNWDTCVHITEDRYNEDKLLHVYNGDLLITKDGTVGKLAIITNAPDKVSLNSGVMIIRNNSKFKYDQQYMFYVLKSDVFTKWFDHHKKPGSTIQHLYQHQFDDFRYPFPSLAEQKNIAAYLKEKCMAIDALIVKKQEAISKLEEYKKSLIYYAVTGKIDCRNEVV